MSLSDTIGYLIFGNPVSQSIIKTASVMGNSLTKKNTAASVSVPTVVVPKRLWDIIEKDYNFVRLAGLSGATAVIMGAYGKHNLAKITDIKDQMEAKAVFETANRFHFLHSFALFAMPLAHRPLLTGPLMAVGTLLFSGTMYYRAFTGDKKFVPIATFGGFFLIAAWLSLIF